MKGCVRTALTAADVNFGKFCAFLWRGFKASRLHSHLAGPVSVELKFKRIPWSQVERAGSVSTLHGDDYNKQDTRGFDCAKRKVFSPWV